MPESRGMFKGKEVGPVMDAHRKGMSSAGFIADRVTAHLTLALSLW
jgi:hypothetical protein